MLTILSYINLLMQPLASTIAAVVWFGLLLGQPQVARRTIGQLLGWLVIVTAISRWLVLTAYQVSVTSTLLIVSLVYVGRRIQQATPLGVLLLDAIVSSLLAAWVYNVALAILSLLTLPLVIQLLGYLMAGVVTIVVAIVSYLYRFKWLTTSFFQRHPRQLGVFLMIGFGMRGLNDYLAYLWHHTAYQGSVMWEILSLVGVLLIIGLPALRHQYDLLTCKLQQRDHMLAATQQYTNQLEKQYLAYRTFRHDYKNILASLAYGIQNGNMADVQYAYESVIATSQHALPETQVLALHLIANVNLRSMLLVKYQQASQQGVQFTIDIHQVFQPVDFKVDDAFYRVFGILLDNAIEAAVDTPEKLVTVVFVASEQVAIINSCLHQIDLPVAEQLGYSSKRGHAGLGLYFVHQFLAQRRDIELVTVTESRRVRQALTFGGAN
ncbi:sensor histidine kinase [Leuconostoc lactis]|uniref:sensor histidine kinase n=1 Tax=Leuconostoc lactis TaxID=1246 RepID=UPI00351F520C